MNGDGVNEIVLGLDQGGQGYLAVLNGRPDLSLRTWLQVWWPSYNAANGETFPAAGDIDGDGRAGIVIGLGAGGQGFTEIKEDESGSFWDVGWFTTAWPAYDAFLGETHPAIGNVDGDAASEIVTVSGASRKRAGHGCGSSTTRSRGSRTLNGRWTWTTEWARERSFLRWAS